MKALVLAAGLGSRLRPLTLETPKPLLEIAEGRTLLGDLLDKLRAASIHQAIINTHYLGGLIRQYVDLYSSDLDVLWSEEAELLETGGALRKMLPQLEPDEPCLVLAADVWTNYPLEKLLARPIGTDAMHLLLVPNPDFHAGGDFSFHPEKQGHLQKQDRADFTYSGYAVIHPSLIARRAAGAFPLLELMEIALQLGTLTGEVWNGCWFNVGTQQALQALRTKMKESPSLV